MVKKAQAEFIVIVGVILLALVAIYYFSQPRPGTSSIPESVYSEQTQIQQSFISMVRKGADKTLGVMEEHGGYPTEEILGPGDYSYPEFTVFMGQGVPFWTLCENDASPSKSDITKWFELALKNYIVEHLDEISGGYKNVSFNVANLTVTANILSNPKKVDITVSLPTKVYGYAMQSPLYPYKTSVDTKLGEIYDFAKDFSGSQASKRFLEVFTTASVYMSKDADDGYPKLPTGGVLISCGKTIYRSPDQVSAYLREIADYVTTQVLWWKSMPVDPSKPKVFAIRSGTNEILKNDYLDLEPEMKLPDGFAFEVAEPVLITNTNPAYTSIFWTASKCISTYSKGYSISYPVIVRVKDQPSGHYFNFASMVFVDYAPTNEQVVVEKEKKNVVKMIPGKCEDIQLGQASCENLGCSADIEVVDEMSKPLEGAVVTYGGCWLGKTGPSGKLKGQIKCGLNELMIFKNSSYDFFDQNVSSSAINGTYSLHYIPPFNAHFRKVSITETCTVTNPMTGSSQISPKVCDITTESQCDPGSIKVTNCIVENANDYSQIGFEGSGRNYVISNIDQSKIDPSCQQTAECKACSSSNDLASCSACAAACMKGNAESVSVEYIPTGSYRVNGTMTNINTMKEAGGFLTYFNLGYSKDVYFNIPQAPTPDYQLSPSLKACLADKLENGCQIQAVSESEPKSSILASCTCSGMKSIMESLSCMQPSDITSAFCTCPSGSAYPTGCGQSCNDPYPVSCDVCCASMDSIKNTILQKCKMGVICQ